MAQIYKPSEQPAGEQPGKLTVTDDFARTSTSGARNDISVTTCVHDMKACRKLQKPCMSLVYATGCTSIRPGINACRFAQVCRASQVLWRTGTEREGGSGSAAGGNRPSQFTMPPAPQQLGGGANIPPPLAAAAAPHCCDGQPSGWR